MFTRRYHILPSFFKLRHYPQSGEVSLMIYNLLGQEVARLIDGEQIAGVHSVRWEAGSMASGIYFYRLRAGDFVRTKKMVPLK